MNWNLYKTLGCLLSFYWMRSIKHSLDYVKTWNIKRSKTSLKIVICNTNTSKKLTNAKRKIFFLWFILRWKCSMFAFFEEILSFNFLICKLSNWLIYFSFKNKQKGTFLSKYTHPKLTSYFLFLQKTEKWWE